MPNMMRILPLVALILGSCDDLADLESWTSNRTFEDGGGEVQLDRCTLVVGRSGVPVGTHIRIVDAQPAQTPEGGLAQAYSVLVDGTTQLVDSYLVYQFDLEEVPEGLYFVDLVLAQADAGQWNVLPSVQDPISGNVTAKVTKPGVYSLIADPQ